MLSHTEKILNKQKETYQNKYPLYTRPKINGNRTLRPIYKLYWFERAERKALFRLAEINEIHNQNKYGIQHPTHGSMLIPRCTCHLSEQNYYAIGTCMIKSFCFARSLERKQLSVWQPFTSRCFFNIHGQKTGRTVPDYFRIRTLYCHFVSYAVWRKETNIPKKEKCLFVDIIYYQTRIS